MVVCFWCGIIHGQTKVVPDPISARRALIGSGLLVSFPDWGLFAKSLAIFLDSYKTKTFFENDPFAQP